MSHPPYDTARLDAELAALREALRAVDVQRPDEATLRARFKDAQRRRALERFATRGSWRLPLAAAAAVVLVLVAVVATRVERPAPEAAVAARPETARPQAVGAFQPLWSSPRLMPSSSYSVVRVRIPLSAFAIVPGTLQDGSIEADLLVGEDGMARGIRFDAAPASVVAVAGPPGP